MQQPEHCLYDKPCICNEIQRYLKYVSRYRLIAVTSGGSCEDNCSSSRANASIQALPRYDQHSFVLTAFRDDIHMMSQILPFILLLKPKSNGFYQTPMLNDEGTDRTRRRTLLRFDEQRAEGQRLLLGVCARQRQIVEARCKDDEKNRRTPRQPQSSRSDYRSKKPT